MDEYTHNVPMRFFILCAKTFNVGEQHIRIFIWVHNIDLTFINIQKNVTITQRNISETFFTVRAV